MMDDKDRQIVDLIQTQFPVDVRPYRKIGQQVGLEEREVIARIARLKETNIIRRVGALIDPRKVGYVSALIAAKVVPEALLDVVRTVNGYVGVTHNYHRDDDFNLWFTLIARDEATHDRIVDRLRSLPGVQALHRLPATRIFKLKVDFKAKEIDDEELD